LFPGSLWELEDPDYNPIFFSMFSWGERADGGGDRGGGGGLERVEGRGRRGPGGRSAEAEDKSNLLPPDRPDQEGDYLIEAGLFLKNLEIYFVGFSVHAT
jgi:hypothetical protein